MKRNTIFQRLTRSQKKHVMECFDGQARRITVTRIRAAIDHQKESHMRCFECEAIARRLGVAL